MAQTLENRTTTPDQNTQAGKTQAAANQTVAAESAALTGVQSTARRGAEATRLSAQVGAETTRRSVETLAEGQRTLIADVAEQFEHIGQQMARAVQESASNLRTFVVPPQGAG